MIKTRCSILLPALLTATAQAGVQKMGQVSECYQNLLSLDRGAAVSSSSELAEGFDLRTIIDPVRFPGPEGGTLLFADRRQPESLTIDLGAVYDSGRVIIRTHPGDGPVYGDADHRRPRTMKVHACAEQGDERTTLVSWTEPGSVPRKQSVAWDGRPVRRLVIDLGDNADGIGSRLADVELFRAHRLPSIAERLHDLDQLLRADEPGLAAYRAARAAHDDVRAVAALRAHFGRARVEIGTASEKHRRYVEDFKNNVVRFDERCWRIPGQRFDWYVIPCEVSDEPPSYWLAGSLFWYLPDYYQGHREPALARDGARMIREWMTEVPCPGVHRVPGRSGSVIAEGWPAIRTANRTGGLARALTLFAPLRSDFDDHTWVNLLYAIWEHAAFLAQVSPELGGNWLTWANERLILTACDFPEFSDQPQWLEVGRHSFETLVRRDLTASGKECEDSTYYCLRAMKEVLHTYTVFEKAGVALPEDVRTKVRNALDFPAWVHQPGFRNPGIGDMGVVCDPIEHLPLVHDYAGAWGRADLLHIASRGREGAPPALTSRAFLPDGWFILRSGWGDGLDAKHLVFRAPPAGCRGHGHQDVLGLVLYGYGRPLLIDPGMTLYGVKGSEQYAATAMHNTVTVDGQPQPYGPGKVNAWKASASLDLADAEHALYPGIVHRRRVAFVQREYYLVIDDFAGTGLHSLEWNYHFLDGAAPAVNHGVLCTQFPSGGNLAIVPLAEDLLPGEAKAFKYVTSGPEGGTEVASTGWRFRVKAQLPRRVVTVLVPFKGREAPAAFTATNLAVAAVQAQLSALGATVPDHSEKH